MRLNPVRKSFWQSFATATEEGCRASPPLKTPKRSGTARAEGPKKHQKGSRLRTESDASESGKEKAFGRALPQPRTQNARPPSEPVPTETVPKADPFKTGKRSGTARAKGSKNHQKGSRLEAENGASESPKKKPWSAIHGRCDCH